MPQVAVQYINENDSLHVLDLLDNPPAPNQKLMNAAIESAGQL